MIRLALLLALAAGPALAIEAECVVRPNMVVELTSAEQGVLEEVLVTRGEEVARGDPIARLDDQVQRSELRLAELRAGNTVTRDAAKDRLAFREAEKARVDGLFDRGAATEAARDESQIEYQLALRELDSAERELEFSRAQLDQARAMLDRRVIRSPVSGVVSRVTLSAGEFVHERAPVATIAALDPLHVEAYLPISDYPALVRAEVAEVAIAAPFDIRAEARIESVDKVFDAASGTFGLRLILPNPERAVPSGIKCRLRIGATN